MSDPRNTVKSWAVRNHQCGQSAGKSFIGTLAGELTPQRPHAELLEVDARESRAYLLGALRDGTFSRIHGTYRISQSDRRWLVVLQDLFLKLGSRSWIYREGKRNVWVVESTCKLAEAALVSLEEKAAFARGYFDAEGGIPRDLGARFYIQLVQKNRPDLEQVRRFLEDIGIECGRIHNPSVRVDPQYWRFYVLSRSHEDFVRHVGSWHPRKRPLLEARMKIWSAPHGDMGNYANKVAVPEGAAGSPPF
jgi:hypothetical protein